MTEQTNNLSEQQKPRLLVVDDEYEVRQMISLCLKGSFNVTCAADAAEAGGLLVQDQFDAVISDVMMPGEDGITFLGRIHESWPDLPVILITGHAQLQMAVNAIKNGAFDLVHKPFDLEHLRKIVMRAVNYSKLVRMEKKYRTELEETVELRTAELKKSMAELDFARIALQQAASEKSTFMSTVTHEMRTPMNGVIGSLELLADAGLSGAASEYLTMARQSADSMMAMINQLLSFNASSQPGAGASNRDLIEVPQFLLTVIEQHKPLFARKGIILSLQMSEALPRQIWTDREKLSRLFEILLGNALKFTENGTVSLSVSRDRSGAEGDMIVCTLTDTGIGIPGGMLERIFEPFVQADGTLARRHEGVGLGLAIARQNALLLNGRIWAEHVPEGGSRFTLTMKINTP